MLVILSWVKCLAYRSEYLDYCELAWVAWLCDSCYGYEMTSIGIIFLCDGLVSYDNAITKNGEC